MLDDRAETVLEVKQSQRNCGAENRVSDIATRTIAEQTQHARIQTPHHIVRQRIRSKEANEKINQHGSTKFVNCKKQGASQCTTFSPLCLRASVVNQQAKKYFSQRLRLCFADLLPSLGAENSCRWTKFRPFQFQSPAEPLSGH